MQNIEIDKNRLLVALDAVVKRTMRMDLPWEWPCAVAYYGILRAYAATGEKEYLDMVKDRVDELISLGLPVRTVNSCAMGHVLIGLHEATGDNGYMDIALDQIEYLRAEAPRFGDGVLQHTVSSADDFPAQAWADTLFMAAYFMLRMGVKLEDEELINDALNQYYQHINCLQDKASGLWYHGYDDVGKNHMSGLHWGRANAWAAYSMSRVKGSLKQWYLYPRCMDVQSSLDEQLSALKLLQSENGLWRTLLDDPYSYEEVSASCGIAAAMVVNRNPLHIKHLLNALDAVLDNITNDGRVQNVSAGTAVMRDRDGYRQVSREWLQGWGQGLALVFLASLLEGQVGKKIVP